MMEEQLITFETAKLAKEKGFDWIKSDNKWYEDNGNLDFSFQGYHENTENKITAPTQSLLQKWLREEHNIAVYNKPLTDNSGRWSAYVDDMEGHHHITYYIYEATYEEALEKGLYEALKLI
jgi:hypothetical protein